MALDPYALCPCGNGQKIKFCCSADIVNELDKVLRSIEGDQRAAALDQLTRLLATRPDNPALLAVKSSIQLSTNDFEGAQKTINHFLSVDPKNPTALSQAAAIAALQGNVRQAVERTQSALEEADGKLSHQVHETMHIVSDVLLSTGDILARMDMPCSTPARRVRKMKKPHASWRIRLSPQLPLFLRQERFCNSAGRRELEEQVRRRHDLGRQGLLAKGVREVHRAGGTRTQRATDHQEHRRLARLPGRYQRRGAVVAQVRFARTGTVRGSGRS